MLSGSEAVTDGTVNCEAVTGGIWEGAEEAFHWQLDL